MGHGNQHHAGLHMRNIDQIGANFGKVDEDYLFCCKLPQPPRARSEQSGRKPAKPIHQTLFSDILQRGDRQAIVFNLHVDTLEPGKSYPVHKQLILLIHVLDVLDPALLTPEQYRLYQAGLTNKRILAFSAQQPEAVKMLEQHVTKKKFGYQDKAGQHLITVCSWK